MACLAALVAALGFYCLAMPAPALANDSAAVGLQSKQAHGHTLRAIRLAEQDRWEQARGEIVAAKDPLAAKLFFWLQYTRRDAGLNFVLLTHFIRDNPEWPGMRGLRHKAETNMPSGMAPRDVIEWFDDYPPLTAKGADRYLQAILATGNVEKARAYLSEWWASTPLSRDDQRNLFRQYNRYINTAAHHKRFDMLMLKGQYENAMAVAQVLQQGYPELALARMALAKEEGNVDTLVRAVPPRLQNDPGLLYERIRWRRRNNHDEAAIQMLRHMPAINVIQNPDEWWMERHIIIRRLLEQRRYQDAYNMAAAHKMETGLPFAQAEWMAGWLALRFLNQPAKALNHFKHLHDNVSSPISKSRASYWAGRALLAMGQNDTAKQWYRDAAQFQTTFYGQMAAAELKLDGTVTSAAPPVLTAQDKARFNASALIQAAHLFSEAGQKNTASSFLKAFVEHEDSAKAYLFGADMALNMRGYHDAVTIAKDATNKGLFLTAQAYPVITDQLQNVDMEWALVHALIRQESVFNAEARSPAGALGLMQLLPGTAEETARKLGIPHSTGWLTARPAHNIRLGSAFMQRLLNKYDGAYPLAIAAYNAGPGRVDKWLVTYGDPRKGEIDIIDWIELIPIYETRNYVHRVVEGTYVYRLRLKNIQKTHHSNSLATPQNLRNF